MQLLNFAIIKLTICIVVGIIIGYLISLPLDLSFYITLFLFALLFIAFIIAKKQFIKTIWFGLLTFALMVSIGVLTTNLHNERNFSNHYSHQILEEKDSLKTISFRIREVLKPGNYYDKYIIDILKVDDTSVNGKSLLNVEKDSLQLPFKVDNIFITKTDFKNLIHPLNPNQFDYKNYLDKKYIYNQLFIKNQSLLQVSSDTHTLFGVANILRAHINSKLKRYNFKPDKLAIINALFLGQRQDISEEVYSSYTNAGAIHILAVSGLHVGIILIILNFVFKPIERLKNGYFLKTILLVSMLWSFAVIAGLSASVTRAVTMFSIVAIAMNLKRPTNVYNTLAISILVILLFKPLFIFDVGFQLSYLAVFAIVIIDPLLYKLWKPKNKIIDIYWHTLTITIAAQFGIIPISLYYFHQFPGLFFISNLVIIPLLGIILGFGIIVILLAVLNLLPQFLADIFGYIIGWMNSVVGWLSGHETFLFKDISFGILYVIVSYILIISLVKLFIKRNYKNLKMVLIAILIFQASVIFIEYQLPENKFIIFHKSRYSIIGNVNNGTIKVAHDLDSLTQSKNKIIKDYAVGNHLDIVENKTIQPIYLLNNTSVLVIDSLCIYNLKSFQPDYVYLRQSPKLNLNRLIDSIKPKHIIADGSNYKSYIEHWENICKKRKLPFHQTSKNGAFIISY
ncbi:ComEC/Rec2 family competence protein [Seonamhaeicola maritimus]|uniref:ComEC family competence protein n=1 Tax=Seonamhaeicola maritimus TaxID=2591822 RepID=A0A5C7GJV6_9FLAO|nr:ComEC/Rec2 family competence protein [Seonamhaeicola maritimus]TXG38572.1 ComEC family competence protein [Seonamhaeicola maritimus]